MNEFEKRNLLVKIARMYYEHDFNQLQISKKLDLSRTYISKLLGEARDRGIVEIKINDPVMSENDLEKKLRQKYNLQKVIAIPAEDSDTALLDRLGTAAAEYLNIILQDGDIIGTAWGHTMHAFSQKIVPREDIKDIYSVQLCGGVTRLEDNIYASDIAKNIAQALCGKHYVIPLPAVMDSVATKNAVMQDKNIVNVMDLARKANIAIFTIGVFEDNNLLVTAGYFTNEEISQLKQQGAVGDIWSHMIDKNGQLCDHELEQRIVALAMNEINSIPTRICIAAGKHKRKCILAALKTGCMNTLVTNESMAAYLAKLP